MLKRRAPRLLSREAGALLLLAFAAIMIKGSSSKARRIPSGAKSALVVAIPYTWGTVLPPLQDSVYAAAVLYNQFESLTRRGDNGVLEPLGARSWRGDKACRVFRFKIDTSRRFSDGSSLSADDFKRSWEDGLRMRTSSLNKPVEDALYNVSGFSSFAKTGTLSGLRALSPDLLEVRFDRPMRIAVEYFSGVRYAAYKIVSGRPIGTGPYTMEEVGGELLLSPNPFYGGPEKRFDVLRIVVTPPDQIRDALLSGKIDASLFAERAQLPECEGKASPEIGCAFSEESSHIAVYVNGMPGRVCRAPRLRRALQAVIHRIIEEKGMPSELRTSRFSPDPQSLLRFQPGRLPDREAKALIKEGLRDLPDLAAATAKSPLSLVSARECEWLASALRQSGVGVVCSKISFPRYLETVYKKYDADLMYGGFSVYNGDPDGLYHILGRQGAIYSPMMGRDRIARLMDAGRQITDRAGLGAHYAKASKAILEDVPYVHLGFDAGATAYNPRKAKVTESFVDRNNHRLTLFEPL